ncbi:MAG: hypothetical protein P4M09_15565 [Devosia sp.]|nr:hypothetical protein [Devosia sp.]
MKLLIISAFLLASAGGSFAQQAATTAPVSFTTAATMPSLKDNTKEDTFTVGLADAQVVTSLKLTCQAGRSSLLVFHTDRACEVSGNGSIINPANQQKLQRTQYVGGYTVKADGSTDGGAMSINYLALGKAPASMTQFSGTMNLKPENTSSGAAAIRDTVLKKLNADNTSGAVIDQRVDTVDLSRLYIPSAGFPSDKGCSWSGNMVFAYQTNSWFMDLTATCDGKDYKLKGNMPWTDTAGVQDQTEYNLTLTLPSDKITSDDALFASTDGANADLFAAVDGIAGKIVMKQSNYVTTTVDGVDQTNPSQVDASGTLTGTNVPLDTVRSLGVLFGLLSENLFGA